MNNTTAVDVFLGHPLVDATEKQFLARLRRDFAASGVRARILANVQLGEHFRQVDFVVVTDARAAVIELKGWRDPVVARVNGRWARMVDGQLIDADGNPYRQAQDCGFAVSDTMRAYAKATGALGPRKNNFIRDLELLVCLYPAVHPRSKLDRHRWVRALGYDDLLERLQRPGPRPLWSDEDWDGFVRHCGLYRDGEDAETAQALRRSGAAVDEYCARFVSARGEFPELVPTGVRRAGEEVGRPDLPDELLAGRDHLLSGASGQGKSLWALTTAVALARRGHVPIWLPVRAFDEKFSTFLARAVAPYTTLPAAQLISSARAAGRHVIFVVDGLNERPESVRAELLAGVQALRLHAPSHAVLVTAQQPDVPAMPQLHVVELCALQDHERQQVLAAYGAEAELSTLAGMRTPLELSVAANCAAGLGTIDGPAELMDVYVDAITDGEATRAVLRSLAWRMHEELRLSLRAPDAARGVRRDLDVDATAVTNAFSCRLVRFEHGRIAFSHERFAHFLAAEALLERCPDGARAAAALNQPRAAVLREDAVGLEHDDGRLGEMLTGVEDVGVLVAAAEGRLGRLAATTVVGLLTDTLRLSSSQMASGQATYVASEAGPVMDAWHVPWTQTAAHRSQLLATGRCLARGLLVDEAARLLLHTEAACRNAERAAGLPEGWTFSATYSSGRLTAEEVLPASLLARELRNATFSLSAPEMARAAAHALMAGDAADGYGAQLMALQLLQRPADEDVELLGELIERALRAPPYHLRLEAFEAVQRCAHWLPPQAHDRVMQVVESAESDNILLSSAQVEALGALGAIEPINSLQEVQRQLHLTLSKPDDANHCELAADAISSQFEDEDVVGPWSQAIRSLDEVERTLLYAMALRAPYDGLGIGTGWLLEQELDLDDLRMRAAVLEFVARLEPQTWNSNQHGVANAVHAVQLLARAGLQPPTTNTLEHRGAWDSFLTLVAALATDDAAATLREAEHLLVEHRYLVPDLLSGLHHATVVMRRDGEQLERAILAALGDRLVGVLVDGLEHPERLRPVMRHSNPTDRSRHSIWLLGKVGEARAAEVLRRFADDSTLGSEAVVAVREIEARR